MRIIITLLALICGLPFAAAAAPYTDNIEGEKQCPAFQVDGKAGRDIILIPGLISSPKVWGGLVAGLKDDYRLHRFAVSGFAETPAQDKYRTAPIAAQMEDITAYIACHDLDDVTLIGHSQGGFIAMKMAIAGNPAIRDIIIVDALPFLPLIYNPGATEANVEPFARSARNTLLAASDADFAAQQRTTAASLVQDADAQERLVQWSLQSDRQVMAAIVFAIFSNDIRQELSQITVPATVIYATNRFAPAQRLTPLYDAAYQALANKRLVEVEDSYHFIMDDQPAKLLSAVKGALAVQEPTQ
jgi:pimeloyl-ACP methyl ester carboxylesterase